ncbi:unnamed protein product [Rhizophagus irregularis]|nr:unnamed protein product [Rhizophagus irregularis]
MSIFKESKAELNQIFSDIEKSDEDGVKAPSDPKICKIPGVLWPVIYGNFSASLRMLKYGITILQGQKLDERTACNKLKRKTKSKE